MAHDMLKLRLERLETLGKGWISDIQFAHAMVTLDEQRTYSVKSSRNRQAMVTSEKQWLH